MTTTATPVSGVQPQPAASGRSIWFFIGESILWILLIGVALMEIAPITWMVSTSLRDPKNSFDLPPDFLPTAFHWQNYWSVINSPDIEFLLFFWNSLKIALLVTAAQLVTCSMAGFAFGRLRFRGRDFLFGLFLASLMVPGTVTLIPSFILIRQLNLMDTHLALILPGITSAFGVFLLRQHFGDYEFNWSISEQHRWQASQWVDGNALIAWLEALPQQADSGDIYARLK